MKAVVVQQFGSADHLAYVDRSPPQAGAGEIRVRVEMAGVNFIDVYNREGMYSKSHTYKDEPPFVLGREGVGVVDQVGADVAGLDIGDRVGWCLAPGGYAEHTVIPAWRAVKIPDQLDTATATTLMLQGGTAHYLSHSLFPLGPEHVALVHAAAGGVGRLLVQLARLRGARVIATAGTQEKAALVRKLGAEHCIVYRDQDFAEEVLRLTDGQGVNVVYDGVGKATFAGSLRALRRRGAMVLYGAASGAVDSVNPLDLAEAGSVWLTRPHMAHYMADSTEIQGRFTELADHVLAGRLHVHIDRVFDLADAAEAHRYLEAGRTVGKLLLRVAS